MKTGNFANMGIFYSCSTGSTILKGFSMCQTIVYDLYHYNLITHICHMSNSRLVNTVFIFL